MSTTRPPRDPDVTWDQARTLEETLMGLVDSRNFKTPEFDLMLRLYGGKQKLVEALKRRKEKATNDATEKEGKKLDPADPGNSTPTLHPGEGGGDHPL